MTIFYHAWWAVGNGLKINPWRDNWMDTSLEEFLHCRVPNGLRAFILYDSIWSLPKCFVDNFPLKVSIIQWVELLARVDSLII